MGYWVSELWVKKIRLYNKRTTFGFHKRLLILAENFDHAQRKYNLHQKYPCCSTKLDSSQKNYPARDELAYGYGTKAEQIWSHVTQPAHLSYPFTKSCCRKLGSWLDLSTQSWLWSIRNSFVTFINWRGCCWVVG
jgi:hypothetical protein